MAEQIDFPVTLVHPVYDDREVASMSTYNQAVWDGYVDPAKTDYANLTPQQKAARTRAENKAAENGHDAAASGNSAANEKTVGTNPS